MDEIIQQQIERWAKKEFIYQMALSFCAVVIVISFMTKHFKSIVEAMPSIRKALSYVQRKWFSEATFRKALMDEVKAIRSEVQYNGGKVVLSDAVKSLEIQIWELNKTTQYIKRQRDITDLRSERMIFRINATGACSFINDAFLRQFGYVESDVLQFGFENIVHDDDVKDMREKWNRSLNMAIKFDDTQQIRDANGTYHKCRVTAEPILIDDLLVEFSGTIDFINE